MMQNPFFTQDFFKKVLDKYFQLCYNNFTMCFEGVACASAWQVNNTGFSLACLKVQDSFSWRMRANAVGFFGF